MVATNCPCGCPGKDEKLAGEFSAAVRGYVTVRKFSNSSCCTVINLWRIHVLLNGLFGISLSTGNINSMVKRCSDKIAPVKEKIRELLKDSDVVNFDETGLKALGKLFWVHNSSNDEYTFSQLMRNVALLEWKTTVYFQTLQVLQFMPDGLHIRTLNRLNMPYAVLIC
ncbi:MAG: transposase [Succinivibrio sp.]|nr:transposase [Succinivibrio sp.]